MSGLTDELVAAARRGDSEALGAVYTELAPKVAGYLRAQGAEDPEGLAQEVFLQVFERIRKVRGGAAELRTFVFSVAHARAVDEHRRRARRPAVTEYQADLDPRAARSAETQALEGVAGERVQAVLRELTEEQQAVITLRVVADLSLEETAAVLGRSVDAVKQLQRRGLQSLRTMIEQGEVSL